MSLEPSITKTRQGVYQGRWRWWYSSIADWMIRNPGGSMSDCAAALNKHPNTISAIANTDMFREYFARRKAEFHREHDYAIRAKLTGVAEASLDLMLGQLRKKGDQIPMQRLESIVGSTLDRLGYAPSTSPTVVVNNTTDARTQTVAITGLTASALEEARQALRLAELRNSGTSLGVIEAGEASGAHESSASESPKEGAGPEESKSDSLLD